MYESKQMEDLIGNTPLVRLTGIEKAFDCKAKIFAKVEYYNPTGSVKDRAAKAMIDEAEKSGRLQKGGTVIEATSGNTGIGLAFVAAIRGYKAVIVMPETMSVERQKLIRAYGAEVVLTDGKKGMQGAVEKSEEILKNTPNAIIAGQFENMANPKAHYDTTGPEIYTQMQGNVDIFTAGVGTGGTLSGIGRYLKEQNPNVKIVAIEPASSPLLSKGYAGAHGLQGIGANFIPKTLDCNIYDEVLTATEEASFSMARELGKREGLFVGITSGTAVWAAVQLAKREENAGKNIVTLLPDGGGRYLSTTLFE